MLLCAFLQSLPLRECGLKFGIWLKERGSCESLPLRECGLKFGIWLKERGSCESLPLRECGLKFGIWLKERGSCESLPLRECGLKSISNFCRRVANMVTPLAGVWIEIHFQFL